MLESVLWDAKCQQIESHILLVLVLVQNIAPFFNIFLLSAKWKYMIRFNFKYLKAIPLPNRASIKISFSPKECCCHLFSFSMYMVKANSSWNCNLTGKCVSNIWLCLNAMIWLSIQKFRLFQIWIWQVPTSQSLLDASCDTLTKTANYLNSEYYSIRCHIRWGEDLMKKKLKSNVKGFTNFIE